jgi:PAS domain S-box-containing protein
MLLFLGNLLFACILTVFKSKTISKRLYRQFIFAKILQSIAWFLLGLRGHIPDLFSAYFGNTFLSIGLGFEALALTTVYKQSRRWENIYFIITVIGVIFMWAFSEKPNMKIFITSLNAAVIFGIASFALIHSSFNSSLRKTIGFIYGALSIFLIMRSVHAFFAGETFGLNSPHLVQSLTFFVTFILMVVGGIGFQLILSEYNDRILDESHRMFQNAIELLPIGCIITDQYYNTKYINTTFTKQFGYSIEDIPDKNAWFEKAYPDPEYRKLANNNWEFDIDRINNLSTPGEPYVFTITSKQGTSHIIEFKQSLIGKDLMVLLIDITEQKQAELALKESEEKYKEAQFIGNVGHWEYDFAEKKLHWSNQMYLINEISKDSFEPDLNHALLSTHINDRENLKNLFYNSIQNKTNFEIESRIITPKGNIKYIITRALPKFDEKGNPKKMLASVVDISERKKAEHTIIQQNKELQKLNADKNRFMQILAHDLRSPFNSLLGFSELLLRNLRLYNIEVIENQLKMIYNTSKNTYNLLEDLLLWSKSQAGKLPFDPQSIDFYSLCTKVIENLLIVSNEKKVLINCLQHENIVLHADENMLKTIVRNLISNAIKFSNEGGFIYIYTEKQQDMVTIVVSDNGVGIDNENQAKLWNSAQPYTTYGTKKEKGTGLGLMLCKEFVEKHGGKIWVESEAGKGSDFKFTMPVINN